MNNLTTSLNYEYAPFGQELAEIARIVLPLTRKPKLSAYEYDILVRSLWVVNHISTKKSHSKLDGGCSASTDCHSCKYCQCMWHKAIQETEQKGETNLICASCYADTNGKIHKNLANRNMINKEILNVPIPQEAWYEALQIPTFALFYRTQSMGETDNITEAINFIRIHRAIERIWNIANAIWSKNSIVWANAFTIEGKPYSTSYIQSSPRINVRSPIAPCIKGYCDHRFTVFDEAFLKAHPEIKINCGGRSCRECVSKHKGCYFQDTEFDINEKLK